MEAMDGVDGTDPVDGAMQMDPGENPPAFQETEAPGIASGGDSFPD